MTSLRERSLRAGVIMAPFLLWAAIVIPVILHPAARSGDATQSGPLPVSQMSDQLRWHEPLVLRFARDLGDVDLSNYASATSPGYHLLLALSAQVSESRLYLQLVNALFGLGFIMTVWAFAAMLSSRRVASLLILPLALSMYVVGGSIWLTTDNLAMWFTTLGLGLLIMCAPRPRWAIAGALAVAAAVFVRQNLIWAIAPALLLVTLAVAPRGQGLRRRLGAPAVDWTLPATLLVAAAALLPLLELGWLYMLWDGLVPPHSRVRELHFQGANPAAIPFALATTGFFGVFFLPAMAGTLRNAFRVDVPAACAAMLALLTAVVVPTSYSPPAGRHNGLIWTAVQKTQQFDIAERSLLLAALAAAGGYVLARGFAAARLRGRGWMAGVLLLTMLGATLAQMVNSQVWPRYFELPALVMLIWLTALGLKSDAPGEAFPAKVSNTSWSRPIVGPILIIALFQFVLSILRCVAPIV